MSKNRYVNTHFWKDTYIGNLDPMMGVQVLRDFRLMREKFRATHLKEKEGEL